MNIYVSDRDRGIVLKLPVIPAELPEIIRNIKNEEFETFDNGIITLIGNIAPLSFSIESFFPADGKNYSFAKEKKNPKEYIKFFNNVIYSKTPIRILFIGKDTEIILSELVTVENFSYRIEKNLDISYKLDFKEYREIL